jgi:hypothetical protein
MAQINVTPLFLKDVILEIGTDSYEKHVSAVTITPTTNSATWTGLNPDASFTNTGTPTWTVDLTFAQDYETTNSLALYLFNNQGQTKSVSFKPQSGTGPTVDVDVVIVAGSIGGAVNSYAETTVSLPAQGQPILVPAV